MGVFEPLLINHCGRGGWPRSSDLHQFRRWTLAGLWELMLEVLNGGGGLPVKVQMIDVTVIRSRHQAVEAKAD